MDTLELSCLSYPNSLRELSRIPELARSSETEAFYQIGAVRWDSQLQTVVPRKDKFWHYTACVTNDFVPKTFRSGMVSYSINTAFEFVIRYLPQPALDKLWALYKEVLRQKAAIVRTQVDQTFILLHAAGNPIPTHRHTLEHGKSWTVTFGVNLTQLPKSNCLFQTPDGAISHEMFGSNGHACLMIFDSFHVPHGVFPAKDDPNTYMWFVSDGVTNLEPSFLPTHDKHIIVYHY